MAQLSLEASLNLLTATHGPTVAKGAWPPGHSQPAGPGGNPYTRPGWSKTRDLHVAFLYRCVRGTHPQTGQEGTWLWSLTEVAVI